MKRALLWLTIASLALLSLRVADAQPTGPVPPDRPARKADPRVLPKPDRPELPPGHPPIQPGQAPPGIDRERLQEMLRRQQQQQQRPQAQPVAPGEADVAKPKYPVDAHGHCLGDGVDDRPKDINLFHGWFGVNNEAATEPPSKGGGDDWWGKDWFGNKDWWAWRLTPYPYRYANHDDHCDPRNQPVPLIANVVNIGILLFLFVRFGKKPINNALAQRKRSIMSEIDKADEIRKSAKKRLADYSEDLKHLDERLAGLVAHYAAEGETEKTRVVAGVKERRERMMGDAEFRISQESETAREALSRAALDSALKAAESLVIQSLSDADHERLSDAYLDEIGPALQRAEGTKKA